MQLNARKTRRAAWSEALMMDLSVVIPMKNEEGNVAPLLDGIANACAGVAIRL